MSEKIERRRQRQNIPAWIASIVGFLVLCGGLVKTYADTTSAQAVMANDIKNITKWLESDEKQMGERMNTVEKTLQHKQDMKGWRPE